MNRRNAVAILTLLVLAISTCAVFAQQPAARAAKPATAAPAASAPVATIGGRVIPRGELDQRLQQVLAEYAQRKGGAPPADMHDLVRRQVLEGLIRAQLMALEAKRRGMLATEAEGEEALKQLPVFNPGGHFDAARYQGIKTTRPVEFGNALAAVREQLGARKLATMTEKRLSPPGTETSAIASHNLTRVTLDMLPLRAADFAGVADEPREALVEAWYRSHPSDYERQARATLTVVFVNAPALADSLQHTPSAVADWNQRMRTAAERIIARVQKGEPLDSVATSLGPRSNIIVAADNFPGYWRGTPAQSAHIFDPGGKGQVLAEPVQGNDGWLVVRVDETTPAHLAPLREVAREIRSRLRRDNQLHRDENDRRALYAGIRDSLAAPGWPIRYATVDLASLLIPEPGPQDLDTYFRAHQADYATFDPKTGGIVSRSLADVGDDVRTRYLRDRQQLEARSLADQLLHVWTSGGRDAALESRLGARVTPAVVSGSRIDTGLVARVLSDTIWSFPSLQSGGVLPYGRGLIVWQGLARVDRVIPTLEQAQAAVTARLEQRRAAEDMAGGRALYDADAMRFHKGNVIHFTRVAFMPRSQMSVSLTRAEVEKWHQNHLERYSAPEMVTARHILVSPVDKTAAADQRALAKAKEILRRIQAGEDFTTLARTYSEDPATRDIGGELGSFARGTMLEPFEKVAFSLPVGALCDQPVKTEMGYHIIKVTEHLPFEVKPLQLIYSAVSGDAADDKANRLAREEADSLMRVAKNPRTFAAAGRKAGAIVITYEIGADEQIPNAQAQPFFTALRATAAGHIVPGVFPVPGQGIWMAVVDSLTPAGKPTWEQAGKDAITQYRREAGTRALEAKRAELDSLLAGGISLDSLAAYWGGLQRVTDLAAGRGLPYTGNSDEVDSLLFGGRKSEPGLPVGTESGWVRSAGGLTRLRIVSRTTPSAPQLAERAEQLRKAAVEQKLLSYFEELKVRYPVVILDRQLRDLSLFAPPQAEPAP